MNEKCRDYDKIKKENETLYDTNVKLNNILTSKNNEIINLIKENNHYLNRIDELEMENITKENLLSEK